jgi:regulation of enolase protein 1 (concanavalin A-like superfamily)
MTGAALSPAPPQAPAPAPAGAGFTALVRSEWLKLRSVPSWAATLVGAVVLTVLVAGLSAGASSNTSVGDAPPGASGPSASPDTLDEGHTLYRPLAGDGTVTARVASQDASHPWAKAGVVIRAGAERGAPYAALVTTPGHGVRLLWGYGDDEAGSEGEAPRWLRLTRAGDTVTGEESANGRDWQRVGTVELDGLPRTVQAGVLVASPSDVDVQRQFGGESIDERPTRGEATFDHVSVEDGEGPVESEWAERDASIVPGDGGSSTGDGSVTVSGSGDLGRAEFGDDTTYMTLQAVILGLPMVVVVAVLFVTSEYRRRMIRTTFAASPARGRVLAAKAVVVGGAGLVVGAVSGVGMILVSRQPAGVASPSLSDPTVLRAVAGTGLLLGLVALLALGAGTLLRHSAGAITGVVLLLVLPQLGAGALPLSAAMWLQRLTPAAGFAVQRTTDRYDAAIGPWAGLAVLGLYTAVALGLALSRLRRRDA